MPKLPLIAIIGRPNTGKSTLFNRLVGRRIAIESPVPGTTRDHIARNVATDDVDYLLLDTGGMGPSLRSGQDPEPSVDDDVFAQSALALSAADLILFTVDGRSELTKSDHQIVQMLRTKRKRHVPVILVITKCDTENMTNEVKDAFHQFGIADDIVTTSAAHNRGIDELKRFILEHLKKMHFGKQGVGTMHATPLHQIPTEHGPPRVAIIGRPNVGKSSLINALMSDSQRKISPKLVSDTPGTTRDATDTIIRHDDQTFIFVDTAGLRRKARIEEDLEGLSVLRAIQAIEGADVCVLLINANEEVSNQDKKIAGTVIDRGKGLIILINKIDLLKGEARTKKMLETQRAFPFCRFAPILPTSAKTRENLPKLFALAMMVHRNLRLRIAPRELGAFLKDVIHGHPMSALKTCKHVTQAKDPPPTFVLFVRNPKTVHVSQLRYIENRMRERFGLEGVPVKLVTKGPREKFDH